MKKPPGYIEYTGFYERERETAPDAFLLTLDDAKLLAKAMGIAAPVYYSYLGVDESVLHGDEMQAKIRSDIITSLAREKISWDSLKKVCDKVSQSQYWTRYPVEITEDGHIYTIDSNVEAIRRDVPITPETHPQLYAEPLNMTDVATGFAIPEGVKFIPFLELGLVREVGKILAGPPYLKSVNPKRHTMLNHKLVTELQKELINDGETAITVSQRATRGKPSEIKTIVMITYDGHDERLRTSKSISEYDRQVMDAICSEWLYGDPSHVFTPAMIYRTITGKTEDNPTERQIASIIASIERLRGVKAYVNATEEMRKRKSVERGESAIYDDYLVNAGGLTVRTCNGTARAYQMHTVPLLLAYSLKANQLITVDADLLDIKRLDADGNITEDSIQNTDSRIAIKGYILRRVETIRYSVSDARTRQRREDKRAAKAGESPKKIKPNLPPVISFDTLFTVTCITKRDTKLDAKKYVSQVLDYYQAKGRLKGYNKRTEKGTVTAVELEF